ncbi:D-xylose ABC transporter ATP-binding protein, partial [Mycobacterium tuberculosis]|nr:D-xylose ABC transporter ATP-binding protein [Mycobacterium tuberculosis]
TKGVDVGAKAEVYKLVASMAQQGIAIILISNELEELLAVSDRIITFYRGSQRREFTERPFDPETVLASMTGQVQDVA